MTSLVRKKIAVIGSGISGLLSAYLLARRHEVVMFEAASEIGGHTATRAVTLGDQQFAVDTGFIVFNDRTYPNFIKLLERLGVAYQTTDMGFSVSCRRTGFEYSGTSLGGVFAQGKNIFNPAHWGMLREILRFNKACLQLHASNNIPEQKTLGEYLRDEGYSERFQQFYILPMVSAIWSSGLDTAAAMPLVFFIRFFHNHGLLTVTQQPQWYTLKGGSQAYLKPITQPYAESIHTSCPVQSLRREVQGVVVTTERFGEQLFDEVVLACHSDQALKLLADPSAAEYEVLSAIPYKDNEVVLHSDEKMLPQSRRAWASWNYLLASKDQDATVLTYNMNILQRLSAPVTFCVTVNPDEAIDAQKTYGIYHYSHPMFTLESIAAQARWQDISGVNRTHYCGAYWRNGFHEDGVVSAIRVAQALGEIW